MSRIHLNAKVVFVGAAFAGKTSILNRYMREQFNPNLPPSTQPACFRKSITQNGVTVNLEMWDTAGQERYHSLSPLFYRDSQIGVIVFDISEMNSFNSARDWAQELIGARGNEVTLIIAANKMDLAEKRAVTFKETCDFAASIKGTPLEVSAKTGENLNMLFDTIAEKVIEKAKFEKTEATAKDVNNSSSGCFC